MENQHRDGDGHVPVAPRGTARRHDPEQHREHARDLLGTASPSAAQIGEETSTARPPPPLRPAPRPTASPTATAPRSLSASRLSPARSSARPVTPKWSSPSPSRVISATFLAPLP